MSKDETQIIRVKTESWVDNKNQLIFKKTIRQMRNMTKSNHYSFESEVGDNGCFEDIDFSNFDDGHYNLICHYEFDENGKCDRIIYSTKRLT